MIMEIRMTLLVLVQDPVGVSAGFTMSILLPRLSSTGELKSNWVKFKQLWDSYEILTGLKNKERPVILRISEQGLDCCMRYE